MEMLLFGEIMFKCMWFIVPFVAVTVYGIIHDFKEGR